MSLKNVFSVSLVVFMLVTLVACNTMRGLGSDIKSGADSTEKVIKDATSD
jgi:predicted small secreted protein